MYLERDIDPIPYADVLVDVEWIQMWKADAWLGTDMVKYWGFVCFRRVAIGLNAAREWIMKFMAKSEHSQEVHVFQLWSQSLLMVKYENTYRLYRRYPQYRYGVGPTVGPKISNSYNDIPEPEPDC